MIVVFLPPGFSIFLNYIEVMYTFELITEGQKACGFTYYSYFIISNLYKYLLNYKQYGYLTYVRNVTNSTTEYILKYERPIYTCA